jgi:hypothetical protein
VESEFGIHSAADSLSPGKLFSLSTDGRKKSLQSMRAKLPQRAVTSQFFADAFDTEKYFYSEKMGVFISTPKWIARINPIFVEAPAQLLTCPFCDLKFRSFITQVLF